MGKGRPTAVADAVTNVALGQLRASITDVSVLSGIRLLENIELTAGETRRIAHGLRRKLRGYVVVRCSASASMGHMHDEQLEHTDTDKYLYLRPEGFSPTVSLLVF